MNAVRWMKSDIGQSVVALWAGYLCFLIVMHVVWPDDPWNRVFFHPVFLAVVPVLGGCIPIVGTKPEWATTDDLDSTGALGFSRTPRHSVPDSVRRFLVVWLAALLLFASPHGTKGPFIDPLVHRPVFLVLAPLWLAAISLFTPWTIRPRTLAAPRRPVLSRAAVRNGIACCIALAAFLVGILFFINDTATPATRTTARWSNVFFVGCLVAVLMRARYLLKLLRAAR